MMNRSELEPTADSAREVLGSNDAVDAINTVDPTDRAFLAQRSYAAPLLLGVVSIVLSPLILGGLFGALGLRAGIDLWPRATRRGVVASGFAASLLGISLSAMSALLWGTFLATVLLGRDAIREAQSWRGLDVIATTLPARDDHGVTTVLLNPPPPGVLRSALLFVRTDAELCGDAIRSAKEVASRVETCQLVLIDANASTTQLHDFALQHGASSVVVGSEFAFPPPLLRVAAFPTLVVVNAEGLVEIALVGVHPASDIEKIMRGEAALPPKTVSPNP